jgi:hypothetical protein
LAATLGHGQNVVCVPKTAAAGDGLHAVQAKAGGTRWASGALQSRVGGDRVDVTDGAAAPVTDKDLLAEITGIRTKTPLVDAVVAAERTAAFGENLKLAPAAERQAIGPSRKSVAAGSAAAEGARNKHSLPA